MWVFNGDVADKCRAVEFCAEDGVKMDGLSTVGLEKEVGQPVWENYRGNKGLGRELQTEWAGFKVHGHSWEELKGGDEQMGQQLERVQILGNPWIHTVQGKQGFAQMLARCKALGKRKIYDQPSISPLQTSFFPSATWQKLIFAYSQGSEFWIARWCYRNAEWAATNKMWAFSLLLT